MAKLETLKGHYQKAYILYHQAETIFKKSGEDCNLAGILVGIAEIEVAKNDYPKASEAYKKAIEHYTTNHDLEGKAQTLLQLAKVEKKLGLSEASQQYAHEGTQILKEIDAPQLLKRATA